MPTHRESMFDISKEIETKKLAMSKVHNYSLFSNAFLFSFENYNFSSLHSCYAESLHEVDKVYVK